LSGYELPAISKWQTLAKHFKTENNTEEVYEKVVAYISLGI
jgi:hypothetical protein